MKNLCIKVFLSVFILSIFSVLAKDNTVFATDDILKVIRLPREHRLPFNCENAEQGTHRRYYKNGEIYQEITCKNGKKEGVFKQYYPHEIVWIEDRYKGNQREGQCLKYYQNGNIWSEAYYKNGKRQGKYQEYYKDGTLRRDENYRNDKKHGLSMMYHENGNLLLEAEYVEGKIAEDVSRFDQEGNLIPVATFGDVLNRMSKKENKAEKANEVKNQRHRNLLRKKQFKAGASYQKLIRYENP